MAVRMCWWQEVCDRFEPGCTVMCHEFKNMKYQVELSELPKSRWYPFFMTVSSVDISSYNHLQEIKQTIVQWVADGNSLVLRSSKWGNGKTSWAVRLMMSYLEKTRFRERTKPRAVFVSVPRFIEMAKADVRSPDERYRALRKKIEEASLVVWDDIATTSSTDFVFTVLFTLIDSRQFAKKANIFTGNFNHAKLQSVMGGRLASRIWNVSDIVEFRGDDMRGADIDG